MFLEFAKYIFKQPINYIARNNIWEKTSVINKYHYLDLLHIWTIGGLL